jgi:hypothetical protein
MVPAAEIRTRDLMLTRQLLYQLSYAGTLAGKVAERVGFEPTDLLQSSVFGTAAINHSATSP